MGTPIVFPDAVATVKAHLDADTELTEPVVHKVPTDRPVSFVQVRRTGGVSRQLVIDGAFVTVDSWADGQPAAMALAQQVRAKVHGMAETVVAGVAVYRVRELAGPADLPDEESGSARVRQSFQIGLRGQEAS